MPELVTRASIANRGNRWWTAPGPSDSDPLGSQLARFLTDVATKIETVQIQRRWRSLVFYRHFSGRPQTAQFAYGMAKRPSVATYYQGFSFAPPTFNLIATCSDVYVNRLFRQQIYLSVVPDRGDFKLRQLSKMLEMWIEAGFQATGFWQLFTLMGLDALTYGSGILKCARTLDDKIGWSRVHPDELLYENEDEDNPQSVIQRVWANREDIYDTYGDTPQKRKAIETAPSAYPAFYFGPGTLECRDVIPLLEGWRLPHPNGKPGRHVLAIGNTTLSDDEKFEDAEFPFEKFDFRQLPSGIFGQGLSEILLRTNEEIDRLLAANTENLMRCGFPKWLVEEGSGVNDGALGDTSGGVVKYARTPPQQIAPPSTSADSWQQLERLIKLGMTRAHISEMATKGEQPGSLQSAVALEKYSQIDDANFAEMGQRLEHFVICCAYKMIRLAKQLKPSFMLDGRRRQLIKWSDVALTDAGKVGLQAFGMSRLPQSISGRQQLLDSMLANGTISRDLHTRFSQVPDIDSLQDRLNAKADAVERMLDDLLAGDDYIPPSSFMDLDAAKAAVEARYLYEQNMGTPQDKLDQFLMWRAAVMEMIEQRNTPDQPPGDAVIPPPGAPGPGTSVPASFGDIAAGAAPMAPSAPQISPVFPGSPQPAPLPA